MQQFFKFMFASCLGVFLAIGAFIVFGIATAASFGGDDEAVKEAKPNSILEIKLESPVPELTDNADKSPFQSDKVIGLHDMTRAIEKAANDNNIKGIVINTRMMMMGFSSASVIRRSIENFKKSGKFVYAYGDMYTQGAYYLASVADSVMINPNGDIDFKGIAAQIPFLKGMFDKLDVKWQIYYAGQFKSATEPLRLDKMSEPNRLQTREYIDGLFDLMLKDISVSRKIPVSELKDIANELKARTPHRSVLTKLADTEGYYDALLAMVKRKLGLKNADKISSIELKDYAQSLTKTTGSGKDKIAVVFAEGDIGYGTDGQDADGSIQGLRYAKIIRKLRGDKSVKGIVLRINSGGGSSFASEIIWRELDLARQEGKVIMSSFGDYAASGGYYIAMASDSIFAEPNTLTGSIGVFGMIPGLQSTFKNKLGVTFDTVKTSKYAAMSGVNINFSDDEGKILQEGVDSTYETFLQRVGTCRKMSRDQVHAIAQGRVWMGNKAKDIGLVDQMGGLNSAIAAAANKAGLKEYKTINYPIFKSGIEKFMETYLKGGSKTTDEMTQLALKNEMGEMYEYYDYFKKLKTMKEPQMRVPYLVQIK
jgi:protease IV